jgi:DNA-binding response OmpR family regulator
VGESILLVEDDRALREITAMHLQHAGYEVEAVGDGEAALTAAARRRPDVVILDLMLPRLPGLEVCRELRARFRPSPGVIMVTARGSEADMVIGLDAGADDYVVKPFAPPILLARLAALCRRLARQETELESEPVRWREIEVDTARRHATVFGQPLPLTPTELALLARLCASPGTVHSRKQLLEDVFGTSHEGYARNVDQTVHGLGYRLGDP